MNIYEKKIQDRIDNKEWSELSVNANEHVIEHLRNSYFNNIFRVNKEFILEFVLNNQYFGEALKSYNGGSIWMDDILSNISKSAVDVGFDVEEWRLLFDWGMELFSKNSELVKKGYIRSDILRSNYLWHLLGYGQKSANYMRLLMEDDFKYTKRLFAFFDAAGSRSFGYSSSELSTESINDLSESEREEFSRIFSFLEPKIFRLSWEDPTDVLKVSSTYDEAILLIKKSNHDSQASETFKDLPYDEFLKILNKQLRLYSVDGKHPLKLNAGGLMMYFKQNPDIDIDDDLLDKIINLIGRNHGVTFNIVDNLSVDQIRRYKIDVGINYASKSKRITISDLSDLYGKINYDLSRSRFFTNEEINAYPNFFDPAEFKEWSGLYITQDTFRRMNSAWNKRQRYTKKLINVKQIINDMSTEYMTIDTIKYLKSKSDLSNKYIIKLISMKSSKNKNTIYYKTKAIKKLINQSKGSN